MKGLLLSNVFNKCTHCPTSLDNKGGSDNKGLLLKRFDHLL